MSTSLNKASWLSVGLRDPEIALRAWHEAAARISDPIDHLRHGKASVEAEGMERVAQAGLELAEQGVDPTELGQIVGMLSALTIAWWWQPAVVTMRKRD